MTPLQSEIRTLTGRGMFAYIDIHFADFIVKIAEDTTNDSLFLASALLSNMTTTQQHVCLDLAPETPYENLSYFFPDFSWMDEQKRRILEEKMKSIPIPDNWINIIIKCKIVGKTEGDNIKQMPLILDKNRLYLQRYWQYENSLAELIRNKALQKAEDQYIDQFTGRIQSISNLFKESPDNIDWQQVAAFAVLNNNFTVITGGPGTGKTTVVTAIIALMLEANPELKISMCAPTGKAQARLQEAIIEETANLNCDDKVKNIISNLQTSTVHRLLGVKRNTPFFWRDADNPLDTDILIVDEASMVSQPLMAKLLQALPESARIILLGDKDQLASVEIGSILGDICDASHLNKFSMTFTEKFAKNTTHSMPELPVTDSENVLVDCAVELIKSHRFAPNRGIGLLKEAVNANDADEALKILKTDSSGELNYQALPDIRKDALLKALEKHLKELKINDEPYINYLKVKGDDLMKTIDNSYILFRESTILCSHRNGIYGIENINNLCRKILGKTRNYSRGLPLMVTKNDYNLKLFNGDIGLCWPDENGITKVYFPNSNFIEGGDELKYRAFSPSQLPEHEVVFAMTVHKSQGSGFQRVLMILPDQYSQVLTSELIYTGITRARKHLDLWGNDVVFRKAVTENIKRTSGLKESLV